MLGRFKIMSLIVIPSLMFFVTSYGNEAAQTDSRFEIHQESADTFLVSFTASGWTSAEKGKDLALLRASELSLEKGFSQFRILYTDSSRNVFPSGTTPVTAQTKGTATVSGNSVSLDSTTSYSGGGSRWAAGKVHHRIRVQLGNNYQPDQCKDLYERRASETAMDQLRSSIRDNWSQKYGADEVQVCNSELIDATETAAAIKARWKVR